MLEGDSWPVGSQVTTSVVVIHAAIDKAIIVCLFWVVVLSALLAWDLAYLYPHRQGGLVLGTMLTTSLISGHG